MTTSLTRLPRRVNGSLGVDKHDPGLPGDPTRFIKLAEYNVLADWIQELAAAVGGSGTSVPTALRTRVDILEWSL